MFFATALMPARMEAVGGEAKTLPATPAVNMPGPMYPAQNGSWPEPPPEMRLTFPFSICNQVLSSVFPMFVAPGYLLSDDNTMTL